MSQQRRTSIVRLLRRSSTASVGNPTLRMSPRGINNRTLISFLWRKAAILQSFQTYKNLPHRCTASRAIAILNAHACSTPRTDESQAPPAKDAHDHSEPYTDARRVRPADLTPPPWTCASPARQERSERKIFSGVARDVPIGGHIRASTDQRARQARLESAARNW